jgi:hypothetical protein
MPLALALAQDAPSAKLSAVPIGTEQMVIYRDFLTSYRNGSKRVLNVSEVTGTFRMSDYDLGGCLKNFKKSDFNASIIHSFNADDFPKDKVRLIDPKTHKRADPGDAIRNGVSVDEAVTDGFAAGVFTFSEIAFDSTHTHAAFSFSFVCGGLCGHGGVIVYHLQNGHWRQSKAGCSRWIS